MSKYIISKEQRGFIVSEYISECRGPVLCKKWAFSTLDQALKFIPDLFKQPVIANPRRG